MKKYVKPILVAVIYLAIQGILGVVLSVIMSLTNRDYASAILSGDQTAAMAAMSPVIVSAVTILSGLITLIIASFMNLIRWKRVCSNCCPVQKNFTDMDKRYSIIIPLVAGILALFSVSVISEQIDLENIFEAAFDCLMNNVYGVVTISLVVPIIEELCFREAILGGMLRNGIRPWAAILLSALLFGLIHVNPCQIFFAGIVGVILAIVYYKSGNIILSTILHVINNTFASVMGLALGDDASWNNIFESQRLAVSFATITFILSAMMFVKYMRKPSAVACQVVADNSDDQSMISE